MNDIRLTISTGKSRYTTKWIERTPMWSELIARFASPVVTPETHEEYMALSKTKQCEIKDVGGFVGGSLRDGHRGKGYVINRTLISLDVDFAKSVNQLRTLDMVYGCAWGVYSTHKHSSKSPKLRLLVPLGREVTPDEYEAVSRKLAEHIGIDIFDDTTFQPERLMFYPSASTGADYLWESVDGEMLNPDKVLAEYNDWKDCNEWCLSARAPALITREQSKVGDPLTKTNIIGTFCRTYSIHEAIETFLADTYTQTPVMPGRYTYLQGSSSGGIITYDDRFSFSHHATDPTSGTLCNAFDLVRLHKFNSLDVTSKLDTHVDRLPSYKAMCEFALAQDRVQNTQIAEREDAAKKVFSVEDNPDWQKNELKCDTKGKPLPTRENIMIILNNDISLKGKIGFNEFTRETIILGDMPWRKVDRYDNVIRDVDDSGIRTHIEAVYGISAKDKVDDVVTLVSLRNRFHPVKTYLAGLEGKWDGEKRVETLLIDYLGAKDTKYTRAVTVKALVAFVARIFRPGTKFDWVLTTIGAQGRGKSTMLRKLGGAWFSDNFSTVESKQAVEELLGHWIIELGELNALKKAEKEAIKQFLSKEEDVCRLAYKRRVESYPRQCVFFGTTNNTTFLSDSTGNRRFWAVEIDMRERKYDVWNDTTPSVIAQVWAEVLVLYRGGVELHLDKDLEDYARKVQHSHTFMDERAALISQYLETPLLENWYDTSVTDRRLFFSGVFEGLESGEAVTCSLVRTNEKGRARYNDGTFLRREVCATELWCECFGKAKEDLDSRRSKEIHSIMRHLDDWKYSGKLRRVSGYGPQRIYTHKGEQNYPIKV